MPCAQTQGWQGCGQALCTREQLPGAANLATLKRGLCQQWGGGRWWAGQLQRGRSVVPEREPQHPPAPAPSSQPQGACSDSKGVGGSVASWPNSLWVMDACQVFRRLVGRQGLGHLSDRSCFSVTRIPPGPAHHPSASREGAFSSRQLLSF